jgi:hypothetical protein
MERSHPLASFGNQAPEATPAFLRCRNLSRGGTGDHCSARCLLNPLREKCFHGVSSASPQACLLQS